MNPTADDAPATRPLFDPELVPVIEGIRATTPHISTPEAVAWWRTALTDGLPGVEPIDLTGGGAVMVEQLTVPASESGPEIPLLVLRPVGAAGPLPAIYHVHGGGMVMGDARTSVENYLPHVIDGLAVLVSVDYRLAPEHPDPAPVEDCYAGLVWTAVHASDLGVDVERIMIAGDSAGGGLAAGTALMARDRQFPRLTHQVLVTPMLDDRARTSSSQLLSHDGIWDRHENQFGWTCLLGERRGGPDVSYYAAPARATDLAGLPRTYIDCASGETFRDEILDYAQRLSAAGVVVDLHMWGGGFHAFDQVAPHAAVSRASQATRQEFVRRALRS